MCGIFGYIGEENSLEHCLVGLEHLEYRGYDSTGIAGIIDGRLAICKRAGKLSNLKAVLKPLNLSLAIGHTRWATHGRVNDLNAHPHFDSNESIAIVHNGIIENYESLRDALIKEGFAFSTETDTEVIVQLVAKYYAGDLLRAVAEALAHLRGSYAFALIHKDHPDQVIAAARDCPLAIGIDDKKSKSIISSDPNAFTGSAFDILFLRSDEIACIKKGSVTVVDLANRPVAKLTERLELEFKAASKEGFEHYLLKEIYEQPKTVQKALLGRFRIESGDVEFESLALSAEELKSYKRIWILACGTSSHAGSIGATLLEELAHLPASCDIASEARYRTDLLSPDTLVIAISQSGETADTLSAVREAKEKGAKILGICNVKNSTLTREADASIFLKAGPEMSVCSSKALTSQIAVLSLFALHMARLRGLSSDKARAFYEELQKIPGHIQQVIDQAPIIQKLAEKYSSFDHFFFMGRRYMYTTALEAALKLKEISYVNANGYPAGELKHGAIALISPSFPVIALCANQQTEEKIASNLMEVKARGAPILAFAPQGMSGVKQIADDVLWLPRTIDPLSPFASTVAGQLFAYYFAKIRGCDIDQPRNLAKSVTVE